MQNDLFSRTDADTFRARLEKIGLSEAVIMEVCGTHTMSIAKYGIRSLLPDGIRLVSGPGCPVCVTGAGALDCALRLSMEKDVILTAYGDMMRVPGSRKGDTLLTRRAQGADVRTVFSAMDALQLAKEHPNQQVVFLAVGFETTAAGTAAAALAAQAQHCANFSMLCLLKPVESALTALIRSDGFACDGLLLPGHVATIIGERGFDFIQRLNLPGVITGFGADDILCGIIQVLQQVADGTCRVQNEYTRAVRPQGNIAAQQMINKAFTLCDDIWRGIGLVPEGGFALKDALAQYDAWKRFSLDRLTPAPASACRCADVICARIAPTDCPLFGAACTPEDPCGPCMVSGEGACAASYRYRSV